VAMDRRLGKHHSEAERTTKSSLEHLLRRRPGVTYR